MEKIFVISVLMLSVIALCSFITGANPSANDGGNILADANKMVAQGLPKDALEKLRPFLLDPKNENSKDIAEGVVLAADCMHRLNKVAEIEEFLEEVLKAHQTDWRVIGGVIKAWERLRGTSYGSIIDNKFQRRQYSGQQANATEHDRIRILQLYQQALLLASPQDDVAATSEVAQLYYDFAGHWNTGWKMQILTDIETLPDYETENWYRGGQRSFAPVDEEGNPILYSLPETFENAKNDGERWRWCLNQATKLDEKNFCQSELRQRADFALSQFGEHTLQEYSFFRNRKQENETDRLASIWSMESLNDNEVIAKLAGGIKRFELPDEFHYIALYKQCDAWQNLAQISENRMQYEKAVSYYEKELAKKQVVQIRQYITDRINQITGNWGRFDRAGSDTKGAKPFLRYIFRNGKKLHLTATEIKIPELFKDIKEYLKSQPKQIDWQKIQIERIGYNMIWDKSKGGELRQKYLGKQVAQWDVPLEPAEKYFDSDVQIDLNLGKFGAFLIKCEMENGNTQYAVVFLSDTAIVQKQLDKAVLYYVADAQTGQPLENVSLDFFGYNNEQRYETVQNNRQRQLPPEWKFATLNKTSDKDGLVIIDSEYQFGGYTFLITTGIDANGKRAAAQRFAFLGFNSLWFGERYDQQYNEVKTFFITDRPVYRPGDTVKYKFWTGTSKYDQTEKSEWAGKKVGYEIFNPRGEKLSEAAVTLDNYGGYAGELELPKDCPLGVFNVSFPHSNSGGGTFRVEEYKKPEYEVSVDAPTEPVALGEKFNVKINARYYFGSPVSEATVKYKVLREKADANWYPALPWDWFYGSGYGWFSYDTPWLPGFHRWGCIRPAPFWNPYYSGPPEVVAEAETKIKPDGTVEVPIDTSLAKALFPDDSQRYSITAEVIDNSRRTITGSGTVLVAREPFKIYTWTDKGHYIVNQKIAVSFQARRLDGKPVSGEGELKLFRLNYDAEGVQQTLVHTAKVDFNDEG
ncbi:MAG: MG2 domain-containing protein, partial [Planctomycetaceae bacterium]|nr:MG2 domain-containing protein [Planctomycetaceae bacterium]